MNFKEKSTTITPELRGFFVLQITYKIIDYILNDLILWRIKMHL